MKIATPPSLHNGSGVPPQPRPGENPERGVESFADLLCAMLSTPQRGGETQTVAFEFSGGAAISDPDARAPDFAPQIGMQGKAFERAKLLVETALTFRERSETPGENRPIDFLRPELVPETTEAVHTALAEPGASFSASIAHWISRIIQPLAGAENAERNGAGVISRAVQSNTLPLLKAEAQARPESPDKNRFDPALDRLRQAEPPATPPTARQQSPFGARLFALDHGLRLVLRLPRLAEAEREELIAAVARLFETFGHHDHEIVIRETRQGGT